VSRVSEPEPTIDAGVVAAFFPYGQYGWRLGRSARGVAREIESGQPPSRGHNRYWTQSDHRAFTGALAVEQLSRFVRMSPDVPVDQRQGIADQLHGSLSVFREAMPYSEAERRWLVDTDSRQHWSHFVTDTDGAGHTRTRPASAAEKLSGLDGAEGEIVSAGLLQVVRGRELMRRWWEWRRETEEFTGQGSREVAYEALQELGQMLVPDRQVAEQAGFPPTYMPPKH
jgi:hypothetical protein